MREAMADLCDVAALTAPDVFQFSSHAVAIGTSLLIESVSTRLTYDRTPAHIARGDLDHYLVSLCLEGEMRFVSGRRDVTIRAGDICLIDMAQPNRTWLTEAGGAHSRMSTVVLPRAVLAPRLANPDSATASLLPRSDRRARLVASQLAALRRRRSPDAGDDAAAVEAMADIVAAAAGSAADTADAAGRADRHLLLTMIKRHIEAHLETESLTAQDLCRRFRLSRASLYRLFEADGGLTRYVQEQRLNRALRLLAAPAARHKRLIDLAVDLQFSSDSTFVRAFRRHFGMTPGEVRDMSQAWQRDADGAAGPDHPLRSLARSPRPAVSRRSADGPPPTL
ncbi:MAG: helix-turn-helix domain-containing protein [Rhodoplanes sp.]|nr:helix-turn-helix domain-containing protein [Rhodoplanes sp.]